MRWHRRFAVLAGVAIAATSPDANAFCRTRVCKGGPCPLDENGCPTSGVFAVWAEPMPLTFRFHARGTALLVNEEARAAVRAAFFRWTDVQCDGRRTSLRFVEGEEIFDEKPLTVDGKATNSVSPFGIFFRDTGWPHGAENGDGVVALTTLIAGVSTGRITYADIEINSGGQGFALSETTSGIDLQTAMTHEVGHYIGLAHSLLNNSIMSADLCGQADRCSREKVASRRLADDDRAAVCALYPPDRVASSVPPAEDGCRLSSSRDGGGTACLLLTCVLLLRAQRQRR